MKTEILYGIHPVYEALAARRRNVYEIYLQKGKKPDVWPDWRLWQTNRGIRVKTIGTAIFKALVGTVGHQGVAAKVDPLSPGSGLRHTENGGGQGRKAFLC